MTAKKKTTAGEIWQTLSAIDCSDHVEKKGNLTYLSWSWAWQILMENYPDSQYSFAPHEIMPDQTVMVHCQITIDEVTRTMWLPVMDHKNKAIANPSSFQVNTAMMRCLTKCISMLGLGAYIYAGEDLPQAEQERRDSPLTDEQWEVISDLLEATDTDHTKFCEVYKIPAAFDLKQENYENAKTALELKLKKLNANLESQNESN